MHEAPRPPSRCASCGCLVASVHVSLTIRRNPHRTPGRRAGEPAGGEASRDLDRGREQDLQAAPGAVPHAQGARAAPVPRAAVRRAARSTTSASRSAGEFFGIVGRNGSGKSTLLKCLAGIYDIDAGTIRIAGRLSPFIELGVGFNPDLTARDNVIINAIMLGLSPQAGARGSTRSWPSPSSRGSST